MKRTENTTEQQQLARGQQAQEVQKPATLDFNDKRKKAQNFKEIVQTTPTTSSVTGSPKLPRHQKVRDLEGSRTPSPSSVSRKSSFTSLFKVPSSRPALLHCSVYHCTIVTIYHRHVENSNASTVSHRLCLFVEDPLA